MNSLFKGLLMTMFALPSLHASAATLDFGVAGQFNVFVFENFTSSNSDVEGAVAAGGSINVSGSYSINERNKAVAGNAVVVAGDFNYHNGSVKHGNIDVGGTVTTSSFGFSGLYTDNNPINFANEQVYLQNLSASLNKLGSTGTATYEYSGIQLTASNSLSPQIFDIDGSLFNVKNNTTFTGFSSGQTVILNISGASEIFNGGTGTDFANLGLNVVYNFFEATTVNTGSGAYGSILAPFADVVGGYTAINGNVIAKSWNNNTQVNIKGMFNPTDIPGLAVSPVPEPESYGMLLAGLGLVGLAVRRRQS